MFKFFFNCREFDGAWAIQQAKKNVEQYYAAVGVLEELELSLDVFSRYIPKFFDGATDVYHGEKKSYVHVCK